VLHNNLMRLKGVGVTASVADAFHHAVQTQFSDAPDGAPRVGSKRAAVHLMPPNTDVVELGAMDTVSMSPRMRCNAPKLSHAF